MTEFEIADPVVALSGSGTARAPYVQFHLNTTGLSNITVAYNLRDLDGSIDNAVQPVALQFRVGTTGNFTNVPAGFVADATEGPSLATKVTAVSAVLPVAANNQPQLQVRVITTDAAGNDEWVGVDDVSITGSLTPTPTDPTASGAATPGTVLPGGTTLLTVAVTPGANPTSTGLAVTANLSAIGGLASQPFYDDGTNGDALGGDNTFSFNATVDSTTTPGPKSLPAAVVDAQSRNAGTNIALTVKSPPSTTIVISEVDADPLLSGTDTANEWFELHNKSASAITLSNWTISDNLDTDTIPAVTLGPGGRVIVAATSGGFASEHAGFAGTVLAIAGGSIGNGLGNGGDRLLLKDHNGIEIDCVSWGSNTTCFNPSATAAGETNTIQRDSAGTDTDTAADWTSQAPTPSGNTNNGSIDPAGVGAANPASVSEGNATLLTVAVTPGANPASTGLAVTADLSAIGGPNAQPLFDDGSNGDLTAGDNTFSFTATVALGTPLGTKSLPALITDAQSRFGNAAISLTVAPPPPPPIGIGQIQGNGLASPYVGQIVTTNGIVTARKSNGFFIQTPDGLDDGDPDTSEGIFVFSSSPAAVGSGVTVTGTVIEFFNLTEIGGSTAVTVTSNGNPLPTPVVLTTGILDPAGPVTQLERFEGMRMHAGVLRSVAPTNNFGEIYTVLDGVARPMREPGIEISNAVPPDPTSLAPDPNIPRWDENPERIMVDTDGLVGSSVINVTSNVTLTGVTGPLDFTFSNYKVLPESAPATSANMSAVAVPAPAADEFTVAGYNIENFTGSESQRKKASLAIRTVMHYPDVIGHIEILNEATLQTLADQVNADAVEAGDPNPGYVARLIPTPPRPPADPNTQNVGFLIKTSRVQINSITQERANEMYQEPSGSMAFLHDRPPLVLRATVDPAGINPRPVIVVVNHLRSFIDIELVGGAGPRVRAKRTAQAESLAGLLQELQAANPGTAIISVGDYNAFQFNDGYTDPISVIKGQPTADDEIVVDQSPDLVEPNFINLTDGLAPEEQYSFVFEGTPQALDHVLVNAVAHSYLTRYHIARNNSDFPEAAPFAGNPSRPEANSDHDMPVAYFRFPPPSADLAVATSASASSVASGSNVTYTITVTNNGPSPAQNVVVSDNLPAGLTFVSCGSTGAGVCGGAGNSRTVTFASLAAQATETVTLVAAVGCDVADGAVLSNSASVGSATADPDGDNNSQAANVTVSNPAPVITGAAVDTPVLWTPNHRMVDVAVSYTAADGCGPVSVALSVASNEPDNGTGDGDTANDWEVVNANLVRLRAERSATGTGRVYTITITATDAAGGSSSQTVTVSVPKSR